MWEYFNGGGKRFRQRRRDDGSLHIQKWNGVNWVDIR